MTEPGLCGRCSHGRAIRSGRGSTFWLCGRSASDGRFARYPALPVLACPGFEDAADASGTRDPGGPADPERRAGRDPGPA